MHKAEGHRLGQFDKHSVVFNVDNYSFKDRLPGFINFAFEKFDLLDLG